jgi:CobQ/CobB/MinD/ParA nucleotide binding domain
MASTKILMYSFKGGSGRTVSAANLAVILAKELRRRVTFIDIDIESAGSSVLFGVDDQVRQGKCWAIQDILRGYSSGSPDEKSGRRERETIQVNRKDFESSLWPRMHRTVWPAIDYRPGRDGFLKVLPSELILRTDHELSINSPEGQTRFGHLLLKIDGLQDPPEMILYDSASGQQATAMFGLMNSHILMIFVRWSRQFIIGTTHFLREYICQERFGRRIRQIFIVPTAVPLRRPPGRLGDDLTRREELFREDISLLNRKAMQDFDVDSGWIRLVEPIHECEALKWDDRVFLLEDDALLKEPAISALMEDYRRLANTLSGSLHLSQGKKLAAGGAP